MPRPTAELDDITVSAGPKVPQDAEIAVIVMSTNSDPGSLPAVKSLLTHDVQAEIIVVNTGVGSLTNLLAPVLDQVVLVETPSRQFAGGTRNLGIKHSSAPFIAFLAADCIATAEWLTRRLEAHRAGHLAVASAMRPAPGTGGCPTLAGWASYAMIHFTRMPELPAHKASRFGLSYAREIFEAHGIFPEDVRVSEDLLFNKKCPTTYWDPEIITLHRYPETLRQALKDQFTRGRRAAAFAQRSMSRTPLRSAMRNSLRVTRIMLQSFGRSRDIHPQVRRAAPIIVLLFAARAIGSLSNYVHRPSYDRY